MSYEGSDYMKMWRRKIIDHNQKREAAEKEVLW